MNTIYLTDASTVAAVERARAAGTEPKPEIAACVGTGLVLSIMRYPRTEKGEAGQGRILALTPPCHLSTPHIRANNATERSAR